ncbi:MAG: family 10 glycosylhydrolase [Cyanobacteria bacterium P01_D01_bin.105]
MFYRKKSFSLRSFSLALPIALLSAFLDGARLAGAHSDAASVGHLSNQAATPVAEAALAALPSVLRTRAAALPRGAAKAAEPTSSAKSASSLWHAKEIRGIYISRYQVTGSARESEIRDRVRYYKSQGINTIIHGVWGNGCPMYKSEVMRQTFDMDSCLNAFQEDWLDWLIDEAHKNDMEVHAYFEKGIKLDRDSPIFQYAKANGWFVPGVDRTYEGIEHYLLDVDNTEVSDFFAAISAEFVQHYPGIDAVQWDDYLGYHSDLPGSENRTSSLTRFVQRLQATVEQANPNVSFDLCHHNPYWSGRYFAADWRNWNADRAFIQVYNDNNFYDELQYAESYAGIAITENQVHRLNDLLRNDKIKSILIFPSQGNPEAALELVSRYTSAQ